MALCTPTDHPAECKMSADFSGCCWDSEVELYSSLLISAVAFKLCQLSSPFLHHWSCSFSSSALLSHQQCILSSTMWLLCLLCCWLTRDVLSGCLWIYAVSLILIDRGNITSKQHPTGGKQRPCRPREGSWRGPKH